MSRLITQQQMTVMLAVASARAVPIVPSGWRMPRGFELRGPRGSRTIVDVESDGMVDREKVQNWVAGIHYGDRLVSLLRNNLRRAR